MPASPKDVAAYLEDRLEPGARPSTLRVVAAAIARNHKDAGFDVPVDHGVARTVLDELTLGRGIEPRIWIRGIDRTVPTVLTTVAYQNRHHGRLTPTAGGKAWSTRPNRASASANHPR